jgi:hypothetical protein
LAKSAPDRNPCLSLKSVTYRIDASDTIVFTDAAWFEFAHRNGFAKPDVLGTSLWSHITDQTTAHLYQAIVHRLRAGREPAQVSFRCDAPAERRSMLLEMTAEDAGAIFFRSVTVEARKRPPIPLIDGTLPRTGRFLTMCSWCKRVFLAERWLEAEMAIEQFGLLLSESLPQITHSICPACRAQFEEAG